MNRLIKAGTSFWLSCLLAVTPILPFLVPSALAAAPSSLTGTGLSYDPYVIEDCTAWVYIADNPEDYFDAVDVNYFVLKNDLDCSANGNDVMWGTVEYPAYMNFNGNGFTMTVDLDPVESFSGLFTQVLGSEIRRLHVDGTIDTAEEISYIGGVAGLVNSTVISEVKSTVDISAPSADYVGGIVGLVAGEDDLANIENSYYNGDVEGADYVGGVAGQAYYINDTNVTANYSVGSVTGDRYVGGIVGEMNGVVTAFYNFSAALVVLDDPYQNNDELNINYDFYNPGLTDNEGNGGAGAVTGSAIDIDSAGENPAYPLLRSSGAATEIDFDITGIIEAGDMQISLPLYLDVLPDGGETETPLAFYDGLAAEVIELTVDEFGDLQLTSDNGTDSVLLGDPINAGELSMITLQYTAGTDTWSMYINDTLVDTDAFGAGTTDYTDITTMTLLLGTDTGYFNGGIGSIGIFDALQATDYNTEIYNGGNPMPYEFIFAGGIAGNVTDVTGGVGYNFYDEDTSGIGSGYCAAISDTDLIGDFGIYNLDNDDICQSIDTDAEPTYFYDEANEPFTIDFGGGDETVWNLLIQQYSNGAWYFAGDDYPELNAYREIDTFSGTGSGTEADPYVIDDCSLFAEIGSSAETLAAYYELASSLNCSATGNAVMVPHTVGPFTGVFDGGNFTVTIDIEDDESIWDIGLFRETNFAHIFDLKVAGEITESIAENTGGLIGFALNSKIESSSSTVTLTSTTIDGDDTAYDAGSLIGDIESGYLNDVFANATVDLPYTNFVGGLIGELENTPFTNAYATGDVTGDNKVGGLIGNIESSTISDVYATGDVFGVDENIGGLAGDIDDSNISECYATGSVDSDGSDYTGGLFGEGDNNVIDECYSESDVEGYDYTGGIFGEGSENTITNTYTTGDIIGESYVGGIIGDSNGDNILEYVYSTGNIEGNYDDTGGILGDSESDDEIYRSYSTSNITGNDDNIGGIVGRAEDVTVTESYFFGTVEGDSNVGGIFGISDDAYIYDSYARGNVIANDDDAGGLIGEIYGDQEVYNSYSTVEVFSDSEDYGGGVVGYNDGDADIEFTFWDIETSGFEDSDGDNEEGKTTEEMKTKATYTTDLGGDSWDFDEIWAIDTSGTSNDGYPFLQWQDLRVSSGSSSSGSYVRSVNNNGGDSGGNDSEYQAEIERATEKEIITKEFTKEADKCEALMMMNRVFEWDLENELDQNPFTDVPDWCEQLANYAFTNGVVEGRSETILGLDTPMSRYEAAVMIYRELKRQGYVYLGSTEVTFADEIINWAAEAVEKLVAEEIVKGFADGTFGGEKSIIKQDLAVILLRTLESL